MQLYHIKKFSWRALLMSGGLLVIHYFFTLFVPNSVANFLVEAIKQLLGVNGG